MFLLVNDVYVHALVFVLFVFIFFRFFFFFFCQAKQKMESLVDVVKSLHTGSSNTHSLIFTLTLRCCSLVDADRCTLYLVDRQNSQLVVMQGDVDIRVPLNTGLAGWVAVQDQLLNIDDAYEDSRFSQVCLFSFRCCSVAILLRVFPFFYRSRGFFSYGCSCCCCCLLFVVWFLFWSTEQKVDKSTGYRTKEVLAMPIRGQREGGKRTVVGVLQLINSKNGGPFTSDDEDVLFTLLNIAGPMLQHSSFFNKAGGEKAPVDEAHPGAKKPTASLSSPSSDKKKDKKWAPRKMSAIGEDITKYN